MECEPTRALELVIGLPDLGILGVEDEPDGELRVHVEAWSARAFCETCGLAARVKERPLISLIDLPCFGAERASSGASVASLAPTRSARTSPGPRRTTASELRG